MKKRKVNFILYWMFWSIVAVCCWNLNGIGGLVTGRGQVFSIVLLVGCLFVLAASGQQFFKSLSNTGIAYLIFMILSVGVGFILRQDFTLARAYACSCLIVLASTTGAREIILKRGYSEFMRLLAIFVCIGSFTVFLSPMVRGYYRNTNLSNTYEFGRWNGFFVNPNSAGFAGVWGLVAAIGFLLVAKKKYTQLFCYALVVGCLSSMVMTFSRGAMITGFAFIISVAFFLLTTNKHVSKKFRNLARITILACVAFTVGGIWFIMSGVENFDLSRVQKSRVVAMQRMLTGQATSSNEQGGRVQFAKFGLEYWTESPFIGHGLGSMQKMPSRYGGIGCHNMHVSVLGESGLLGFIAYLIFLILFALQIQKYKSSPPAKVFLYGVLGVYILYGMSSHNILDDRTTNVIWGIAFAVMSITASRLQELSPQQHPSSQFRPMPGQYWTQQPSQF